MAKQEEINWNKLKFEAMKVLDNSYAPFSDYNVSAALLTSKGNIYTGVNVENSSFGLTNCAERTAVFKAVTSGELKFDAIFIMSSDKKPAYPCGACRQVLAEFSPQMLVGVYNQEVDNIDVSRLDELLPHTFHFKKKP